jgi:hypothetical protein
MIIEKVVKKAKEFCQENLGLEGKVIGVENNENGQLIQVEILEEQEYMRKFGRHDLMAVYEIEMNEEGKVQRYKRTKQFQRGNLDEE